MFSIEITQGGWVLLGILGYCVATAAILRFNYNAQLKKEDDNDRRMR